MPRYFTHSEAEALLPKVETLMRQALNLKREHDRSGRELDEVSRRVTMMGGMALDRSRLLGQRARRDASALRLNEIIEEVHHLGAQIKDLDTGLLDFPTLYRGEEVLLCWKLGESSIEYWHGVTEGFRGRKEIDAAFLADHRGDPVE